LPQRWGNLGIPGAGPGPGAALEGPFLVYRLEEKGLVKRAVGQHDRRVKAVSLRSAGATVRKRLVAASAAAPVFAVLTKTQKQQLTALLGVCLEGTRP
jgi:DNA-binding MarR family transcriptional regulator